MQRLANGVYIPNKPSPGNIARIDNAVVPHLARMMQTGACVDMDALSDLSKFFARDMTRLEDEIESACGIRINPSGSSPQSSKLLFKTLKIQNHLPQRKLKITEAGRVSTGKWEIEPYVGAHPVVRMILDWRTRDKLKNSYADVYLAIARKCPDNAYRIFYTLKNCATDTGRLAGEAPNPMTAPIRTELGRKIKSCFIASPHCRLVEADYSQIEMRIAAHEFRAPGLIDAFKQGKDVHVRTAVMVFGLPEDQIDEMIHRYPMKRTGFGVLYLITGVGLARQLNVEGQDPNNPRVWTADEGDDLIEQWYAANEGVRDGQEELFACARRYGMNWTMFGRVRLVPEARSCHSWVRSKGLRQGANLPIQGGAADLFRMALTAVGQAYEYVRSPGVQCEMIIPVHDAILSDVDEDIAEDVARMKKETMEQIVELRVPVKADIKLGTRWAELKKAA